MILLRTVDPIDITFASDLNLNRWINNRDHGCGLQRNKKLLCVARLVEAQAGVER